jgi:hypothetical protein
MTLVIIRRKGGAGPDFFELGRDSDYVSLLDGDDYADGRGGRDSLFGGAGADTLRGGAGDDLLNGGDDADVIYGGAGDDHVFPGAETDYVDGGAGFDTVSFAAPASFYEIVVGPERATVALRGERAVATLVDVERITFAGETLTLIAAVADELTVREDGGPLSAAVLRNDAGGMGPLRVASLLPPEAGAASIVSGRIRFDPGDDFQSLAAGEEGRVAVRHVVTDGVSSAISTLFVTVVGVNDAPEAARDRVSAVEDAPLRIAGWRLRANDRDVDGDALRIVAVGTAQGGTAALSGRSIVFTPHDDFWGRARFDYTVSDGKGGFDTETVRVRVAPVDDAPAARRDRLATAEDTPVTVAASTLLRNDRDADGDAPTVVSVGPTPDGAARPSVGGTATLSGGAILFAPDANFFGRARFDYTVSDGRGGFDVGTVVVRVAPVNDAPAPARDRAEVGEDGPAVVVDALANDADPDGDALALVSVDAPDRGRAWIEDGKLRFDPAGAFDALREGERATVRLGYAVTDGIETVRCRADVVVIGANDAPLAADDRVDVAFAEAGAAFDPTTNDRDAEGGPLRVLSAGAAAHGSVSVGDDGRIRYAPDEGFFGADAFDYVVVDDSGATDRGRVEVVVAPPPPEVVTLRLSGQSFLGDPAFDLYVNGALVAAGVAVPAPGSPGAAPEPVEFAFELDPGTIVERVAVAFSNDLYGGRPERDRNLRVHSVAFGGEVYEPGGDALFVPARGRSWPLTRFVEETGQMKTDGALVFTAIRTVTVHASGQDWRGDPRFDLIVNGETIWRNIAVDAPAGARDLDALEAAARPFLFRLDAAVDIDSIGVAFRNDADDGAPSRDRNLFVSRVEVDGVSLFPSDARFVPTGDAPEDTAAVAVAETGLVQRNGVLVFDLDL